MRQGSLPLSHSAPTLDGSETGPGTSSQAQAAAEPGAVLSFQELEGGQPRERVGGGAPGVPERVQRVPAGVQPRGGHEAAPGLRAHVPRPLHRAVAALPLHVPRPAECRWGPPSRKGPRNQRTPNHTFNHQTLNHLTLNQLTPQLVEA